jgi:drug/metabolite transporter (DMT)-like permease
MGIIFALLSCVLIAVGNILLKKSFKDFPPSVSFFIFSVFSVLFWAPLGIILGVQFNQLIIGFLVGIMSAILGQGIYMYVLEKGTVSITATILSSFSIYTIIFSLIFNHERPGVPTLLFIALTVIGTIIVSLPEHMNGKDFQKINFILWAVFAAVSIGAADTLTKFYITQTSVGSFLFYVAFMQLFVSFIYLRIDKQPLRQFKDFFHKLDEYKFALLGSGFIAFATMFLFLSFNFTLASIASPIAASSPIITVILAVVFLKEKITPKNFLGLLLLLISIIAIGIVNP